VPRPGRRQLTGSKRPSPLSRRLDPRVWGWAPAPCGAEPDLPIVLPFRCRSAVVWAPRRKYGGREIARSEPVDKAGDVDNAHRGGDFGKAETAWRPMDGGGLGPMERPLVINRPMRITATFAVPKAGEGGNATAPVACWRSGAVERSFRRPSSAVGGGQEAAAALVLVVELDEDDEVEADDELDDVEVDDVDEESPEVDDEDVAGAPAFLLLSPLLLSPFAGAVPFPPARESFR
jgi:hypothetical protein